MANIYDSIPTTGKAGTGNIYDSLPATDKTGSREYEGFEAPIAAVKNLGPSARKFASGVKEAIVHPVQTTKGLIKLAGGAALHALLPWEQEMVSKVIDAWNPGLAQRMMDTARAVGGEYVERYGTPERIERTFATDPVGFAADLSTILTGGAGAVRGATAATANTLRAAGATGAASNVAAAGNALADSATKAAQVLNPLETNVAIGGAIRKGGNALANAGAPKALSNVVGATGHVAEWLGPQKYMDLAAKGVASGVGATQNALNPKARAWLSATEGEGQKVIDRAKDAIEKGTVEIVPGTKPTIAEVVSDLELVKLAKFDQDAKAYLATKSKRLKTSNDAAVLEDLGKIAKTDDAFNEAKRIRDEVAEVIYERPHKAVVTADKELSAILKTDAVRKAIPVARAIASNEGRKFRFANKSSKKTTDSVILDARGNPIQSTRPAEPASYSGESLHDIKMVLDKMTSDPETYGIDAKHAMSVGVVRDDLVKWMNKNVPGFEEAQLRYQEVARPLDRMKIGKELKETLSPIHGEGVGKLRTTPFESAMADPAKTIKSATGKDIDKFEKILSPEEMKIINRVRDHIRREKKNEDLAKYGRVDEPRLTKIASDVAGDVRFPQFLNTAVTAFNAIFNTLKNKLDQKNARRIATEIIATDLKVPIKAIEDALAHEEKVRRTKTKVEKRGKAVGSALRTPAVYNMLAPQAEPENALAERW